MRRNFSVIVAAVAISGITGCAGKHFVSSDPLKSSGMVRVTSAVPGALVTSNYGDTCVTPCTIALLSEKGGELTVSMDGYQTQRHKFTSSVDGLRVLDNQVESAIEFSDPDPVTTPIHVLAMLVDGKGAVMSLDKHELHVEMEPLGEGETDLLGPATPVTGDRLTLDEWEAAQR